MAVERSTGAISKASENRRSTKPIMEKRRRARINNSLTELKNLILDALKKDNARHSKLEKADILEMTVKHLQDLQRQQVVSDPSALSKFRAGFNECSVEVNRFLSRYENLDPTLRQKLQSHLTSYMHPEGSSNPTLTDRLLGGVQLVPTRLPSGEVALLLPNPQMGLLSVYPPNNSVQQRQSPISVLGSSGILSPAASERSSNCSPCPVSPASSVSSPHPYGIKSDMWRPW